MGNYEFHEFVLCPENMYNEGKTVSPSLHSSKSHNKSIVYQTRPMPDIILMSAIFRSRKQPYNKSRKLFFPMFQYVKLFVAFVITAATITPFSLHSQTRDEVPISSFIVKERGRSVPLMAKDIERAVSPASLTKILTCIMAIESGRLEEDVVITKEATMVEPSKAGFNQGDRIKLIDLVKAALVNSSNDAAFAIAIHLSGNVDSFVAAMNYRAQRIGMKNSRFTNPAGFDNGIYAGNISTAEDLLRLTEYAVKNPVFNQVARLEEAVFMEQTTRKLYCLRTHNKLLDKYPYAVGIKTGYTCRAGGCLIARAIKDNRDILLVMLNAKTDRWNVAANIFDTAFSSTQPNAEWFSRIFRGDSGNATVAASVDRVDRRVYSRPTSVRKSTRNMLAGLRSSRRSQHNAVVELRGIRRGTHHAVAELRASGKSKRSIVAGLKYRGSSNSHQLAGLKRGHRVKNHDVVLSKPVRKNRRRVAIVSPQVIINKSRLS